MAKKIAAKKKTSKKAASRSATKASSNTKKKTAKKTAKKPAKKTSSKKVTKKKVARKPTAKKTAKRSAKKTSKKKSTAKPAGSTRKPTKKTTKKTIKKTSKAGSKKVTKKSSSKAASKKATTKNSPPKTTKATAKKSTDAPKTDAPATQAKSESTPPKADEQPKAAGTGDTKKRRSSKARKPEFIVPIRPLLLGPNGPALKPLIPSGSNNKREESVLENVTSRRKKTPLTKSQLEKYREILLQKRAELLGDMRHLEDEALRSDNGRNSNTSQHLDDAGSESYEQSLNLNLAAADRERIVEIDAALDRIANRTYGLCELTFEPIKKARLDEIPWTRYTIEAARELDRRGGRH